jgi:GTP-binding protein YchF
MEIAILGLPQSGKSTIFEIMTGIRSSEQYGEKTVPGRAAVPDARFDALVEIFKPAKVSPAQVPFTDVNVSGEDAWNRMRQLVGGADGVLHIVDAFTAVDASEATVRYRELADELIISDLSIVENKRARLAKLPANALDGEERIQAEILPRIQELLESGRPMRSMDLSDQQLSALKTFSFWTLKPELIVVNTSEDRAELAEEFAGAADTASPVIGICAQVEAEIAELPAEERLPFLHMHGVEEPAFERIIRRAFSLLGRISYFTVGEDEVKAWVIPENSTAPRAAAAIHKDFERGFIKAEVVAYDDFIACGKTLAAAKAAGKQRLEGKDYIVQDGDIISFRFNV